MTTLHPVILPVPEEKTHFVGREKVAFLSRRARAALSLSAGYSHMELGELAKDEDGAPLPSNGFFWSLTHKRCFVGGVVSPQRIGMDIEEIKPRSKAMFKKVAVSCEWSLSKEDPDDLFYRFWTAKESVIKAWGAGLKDLLKIRVIDIPDENNLTVRFSGKTRHIEHCYFNRHIASIVTDGCDIKWRILPDDDIPDKP
jgi:4'-phosphopantetheinyl transferase